MKVATMLCVVALWAMGCGVGNGERVTDSRTVGEFKTVQATQGLVVSVTVGEPASVSVEADSNLMPFITSVVVGDTLRLGLVPGTWVTSAEPTRVTVVTPVLTGVEATSAASVKAEVGATPDFSAAATSSARVEVVGLQAERLRASATSSARLVLSGQAASLDAHATSTAMLALADLRAGTVQLDATSGSKGVVVATEEVAGSVDSGAFFVVRGSPARRSLSVESGATVNYEQ